MRKNVNLHHGVLSVLPVTSIAGAASEVKHTYDFTTNAVAGTYDLNMFNNVAHTYGAHTDSVEKLCLQIQPDFQADNPVLPTLA